MPFTIVEATMANITTITALLTHAGLGSNNLLVPGTRYWLGLDAERVAGAHGYTVGFEPLGVEHPEHGAPSQMAVFDRVN